MKYFYRVLFISFLLLSLPMQAEIQIPELQDRVMDLTNTLTQEQKIHLADKLKSLESEKGSQLAILIIPTTDGETIEQFSLRVVEKWKLGRSKVDDGILILVAKDDRKMRIEVGYGLEGSLPDAICKRIITEQMRPSFKSGNYYEGLESATESIIKIINGEPLPEPKKSAGKNQKSLTDILGEMVTVFIFVSILASWFIYWNSSTGIGKWMISGIFALIGSFIQMFLLLGENFSFSFILVSGLICFILFLIIILLWTNRSSGSSSGSSYSSWSSSSSDSSWSSSSSDSFSGGGGSFGGGGASGDW